MRLVAQILLTAAAVAACASARIHFPFRMDPYDDTHHPWGEWGHCTSGCVQFRRRRCRANEFFTQDGCIGKFQKQSCLTGSCLRPAPTDSATQLSANLSSFDCGRRPGGSSVVRRIFGGRESRPHSWPWHVSLVHSRGSNGHFCGGTLVHPQFALTAKHCVTSNRSPQRLFVKVGDHDLRTQRHEQWVQVSKVLTHPDAKERNVEFDMALLRLRQAVNLSEHVGLACTATASHPMSRVSRGRRCVAVGFGRFARHSGMSDVMREVELRLQPPDTCRREYWGTDVVINPDIHVCAASRSGGDTCSGDSGGGLFCREAASAKWFLHGVTSFGHPRGCGTRSGVFQRVSAIANWLQATIFTELQPNAAARSSQD